MAVKIFSKPQTQQVVKDLRAAGYPVKKISDGHYRLALKNGDTLFEALIGSRGYLVRYDERLLTAAN